MRKLNSNTNQAAQATGELFNVIAHKPHMLLCSGAMCNETMYFETPPSTWYCECCKWCLEQLEGADDMEEN